VLAKSPDPAVVTDAAARRKIVASGWPWRVRDKQSGVVLVLIPAGEFQMGSPNSEQERAPDERQHRRVIRKPYYLGETEVTQAQWQRVTGSNRSSFQGTDNPVEGVSWDDVQLFLQKTALRLPSEAEWEYACRAGTTTPFSFGGTMSTREANYDGNYTYGNGSKGEYRQRTVAVGTLGKNAWGLFDMHGNVREWCADGYEAEYPGDGADESPVLAGAARVVRGGSWNDVPRSCRAAGRNGNEPADRGGGVGFRAARTL
jgi:formylglycine-generating enzyme required for sulfatase activity